MLQKGLSVALYAGFCPIFGGITQFTNSAAADSETGTWNGLNDNLTKPIDPLLVGSPEEDWVLISE
jgi:hypothetical protein